MARYALNISLVVIVGATAGILWLTRRYRQATLPIVGLVLVSLGLGSRRMVAPFRAALEREVAFVREAKTALPAGALVFARLPEYNRILQGAVADHWEFLFDPATCRDLARSQRPLVLYTDLPTSKDDTLLRRGLGQCGWRKSALRTAEIDGAEVGFYLLQQAPVSAASTDGPPAL